MALIKMKPTLPGHALRGQSRPLAPAQGRPARVADRAQKKHRRAQPLRAASPRATSAAAHEQQYRIIDFKRDKDGIPASSSALEYDPNRTAHIALVLYKDGERRYILAPKGVKAGDEIRSGADAPIKPGNAMPLRHIPVGSTVHNIELKPGKGGQLARSAGGSAQFAAREGLYASVRLKSGEIRKMHVDCRATIGEVGNDEHNLRVFGKAGAVRWLRRAPDGARRGDEPGRSPARRRRGQVRPGQPASR